MFFCVMFTAGLVPVAVREIARARDNTRPVMETARPLALALGVAAYAARLLLVGQVLPADIFLPLAALAGTALIADALRDGFTAYHTAFEHLAAPSPFRARYGILTAADTRWRRVLVRRQQASP